MASMKGQSAKDRYGRRDRDDYRYKPLYTCDLLFMYPFSKEKSKRRGKETVGFFGNHDNLSSMNAAGNPLFQDY